MSVISKAPPEEFLDIVTDVWTEPFWKAASEHRLTAPRCSKCDRFRMPPTPFCPYCRSQMLEWPILSGEGILYSYTVVSRAIAENMKSCVPYVPAVVELPDAGNVRLITNIIGAPLKDIKIGIPVRVIWQDRPSGYAIPWFELVRDGA